MSTLQHTIVIIKPDYMDQRNHILQLLLHIGFRLTGRKIISFSPEQAAEFYKELEKTDPCFAIKVMSFSKGPSEAIILNKVNAVKDLLTEVSCCRYFDSGLRNKIHVSASEENAAKEILFIFPNIILSSSRKLQVGSLCGNAELTGLFANAIFDASECQTKDLRSFLSDWLYNHPYELGKISCSE